MEKPKIQIDLGEIFDEAKRATSTMKFGKYKDQTLEAIMEFDPGYIVWLHDNVENMTIDEEMYDEACTRAADLEQETPAWNKYDTY